jgi:general stress protein 26
MVFTNEFSEKAREISGNNEVIITYSHPTSHDYIVVNGIASVITDKEKIRELWQPVIRMWFPRGLNDTKLCLLKVEPTEVEYWSGSTNRVLVFFKMVFFHV